MDAELREEGWKEDDGGWWHPNVKLAEDHHPRFAPYRVPAIQAYADAAEAKGRRDALAEVVRECGVEHDDARLDYVTVQVTRSLWQECLEAGREG